MKSLKKMLSGILAATMLASCMGSMVVSTAAATDEVLSNAYFEDFSDGEVKWIDSGHTADNMQYEIITDETENSYMKVLSSSNGSNSLGIWFNTISEGKYRIKFDYMTNDTANKSWVTLERQFLTRPANEYLSVLAALNGNYCVFTDNATDKVLSAIEPGVWYTQEVIIDMDTHEAVARLYKKNETTVVGTYKKVLETTEWSYFEWPNTITAFDHIRFRNSAECYVDNISIDKLNKSAKVIFAENYDEPYSAIVKGTGEVLTEENNNYMHIDMTIEDVTDWAKTLYAHNIPTLSKGNKYQIKFDYMTEETTNSSHVALANRSNYNVDEYLSILGASGGKLSAFGYAYLVAVSIEPGQWYTQYITIDIDTRKVEAAVYKKGESTPLGTLFKTLKPTDQYTLYEWPATVEEFTNLIHYGGNDGYIDDIEIKQLPADDPNAVFSENYEDSITPIKSGVGEIVTDENGNSYLKMNNAWNANALSYDIPAISSGTINIEFDYNKPNKSEQTYVVLGRAGVNEYKEWLKLFHVSGGQYGGAMTSFLYDDNHLLGRWSSADTWYTVKVTIDMESHFVTSSLYIKGNETPIKTISDTLERTASNFSGWPETSNEFTRFICFGDAVDGSDGYACIDNIKISVTQSYDAPTIDSEGVTIKTADGEEQLVWTEVASSAKVIDLDFGTTMDQNTMTGDYIYVTKKDSEDKIPATVTYDNEIATVTANDNWEAGTYTIHVSKDVKNASGVALGDDFAVDFTVKQGKISAMLDGIYCGDAFIGEFSEVTAGMELLIPATFMNETGRAATAKFITGYYNTDGALVGISESDVTISAEAMSTQDLKVTVEEKAGATMMVFFLWNGYSTMSPIASSYPLN